MDNGLVWWNEILAGGHPGAIVSTSTRLGSHPSEGLNLLRHEHEFLDTIIPEQLERLARDAAACSASHLGSVYTFELCGRTGEVMVR